METPAPTPAIDSRLLQLSPVDNVGVATTTLEAGETVMIHGRSVVLADRIPTGQKVAMAAIAAGEKVIKYGLPIGTATAEIHPGRYIHTHNLKSDYLPTYTRDVPY
ncbi:MAG: UxaA family hydrolase [Pirellulales bacterium]|nr:UxaA family hydrolase [Pirellulales bacterium]